VLRLRVIAPVGQRDEVLEVLRRHVGVTHVVVHRDAALDPPGDEITADIARESANDVVDIAAQSATQLLVNLVGITLAGVLVLGVRRRHASRHRQFG
jgi:hypothetical protein